MSDKILHCVHFDVHQNTIPSVTPADTAATPVADGIVQQKQQKNNNINSKRAHTIINKNYHTV